MPNASSNGEYSGYRSLKPEVLQVVVLSPLLFVIFATDVLVPENLNNAVLTQFADDTPIANCFVKANFAI